MRRYFAECLGTFILVFCGTGAIMINHEMGGIITHPGVAATFGLVVMVLIYTLGDVSGCHINPAVTIAFTIAGRFPPARLLPYIASQLAGALLASLLLRALFPANATLGSTLPVGPALRAGIIEFFLSFFLMLVIMRAATGSKEQGLFAGVAIGATVLLEALFAGPVTGASMNPARSLAPAVISGHTEYLWLYLVVTTAGMALAVFAWKGLHLKTGGK
ncbi:MAG: family channel protein [Flaviaesturariibacter sp.]|nr:family channel protein [Flaviaesturariibacter sp.]